MRGYRQSPLMPYCRAAVASSASPDVLGKSELAYLAVGELPLLRVILDAVNGYTGHRGWSWK